MLECAPQTCMRSCCNWRASCVAALQTKYQKPNEKSEYVLNAMSRKRGRRAAECRGHGQRCSVASDNGWWIMIVHRPKIWREGWGHQQPSQPKANRRKRPLGTTQVWRGRATRWGHADCVPSVSQHTSCTTRGKGNALHIYNITDTSIHQARSRNPRTK